MEAVRRVTDEGAYSNLLLPALLDESGLSPRDRGLVSELARGTLRRKIPIDRALGGILDRPLSAAPNRARAALRVGAYQLLATRIPAHAAVAETVRVVHPGERGLVNAVLRRLAREGVPPVQGNDPEALAARTGLAAWAVEELQALLGGEAEEAAAALAEGAGLTLRTNPCRGTARDLGEALRRAGLRPEPGRLHAGSLRIAGGRPRDLPGYAEGRFAVQDEASSWVVDVLDPRPGDRILDACAAPGGKSADIACRAGSVVAADRSERRTRLVVKAARRLGVRVLTVVQDARRPALRGGFDRVLVDAPCSGIGAARRRPELLWRPSPDTVGTLSRLQVEIAVGAASLVRPGGVLVYAVCTFPRAETDGVLRELVGRVPALRPAPFPGPDGAEAPTARVWPHRHVTDAMFVARFVLGGAPSG